jgi:hypothetical protein
MVNKKKRDEAQKKGYPDRNERRSKSQVTTTGPMHIHLWAFVAWVSFLGIGMFADGVPSTGTGIGTGTGTGTSV